MKQVRHVGWLKVEPGVKVRQYYEVAAWFSVHALTPGIYKICEYQPPYAGSRPVFGVYVASTITDACKASLFGGVSYGPDTAGQSEIGTASEKFLHVDPTAFDDVPAFKLDLKHFYMTMRPLEGHNELSSHLFRAQLEVGLPPDWLHEIPAL